MSEEDSIVQWASGRTMLLVLDNCEHVLRPVASLAESLLAHASEVTLLATSREPLMVQGEHVFPVPSLSLTDGSDGHSSAAHLFIDRARSELPSFEVGDSVVVDDICERLDGIPLALELAASRVRSLSLESIASHLDERFRLLTGGRRTAVERHATLRATVDWSYDLLDDRSRTLFDRLSVFAGPFDLADARALSDPDLDELDVVEVLAGLVDRSLVVRDETHPEYRLLETLRAYGRERLETDDLSDVVRSEHARLMAEKAAIACTEAVGPSEADVVRHVRSQISDYAGAASWALEAMQPQLAVDIAENVLLVDLLGLSAEPQRWLKGLAQTTHSNEPWVARAKWVVSEHALFFDGDFEEGDRLAREAIGIDPSCVLAHVMAAFAAMLSGRRDDVLEPGKRAVGEAEADHERSFAFMAYGNALFQHGRLEEARAIAEEWADWAIPLGAPSFIGMAQHLRGRILSEDHPEQGLAAYHEGLNAVGDDGAIAVQINIWREIIPLAYRSNPADGVAAAIKMIELTTSNNDVGNITSGLAYMAGILVDLGRLQLAARVAGHIGEPLLSPTDTRLYGETLAKLAEELGARYDQELTAGRATPTPALAREVLAALRQSTTALGTDDEPRAVI